MKNILDRYESISGQMINYTKSSVSFSKNTLAADKEEVCAQLGVLEQRTPCRYLGMQMTVGKKKITTFSFFSEKVDQKLQIWRNQKISKAGKVTLLKSAAQVIPNFWINMMLIPGEVCDKIEKQMNGFWWGNGEVGRGIRWLAWDKLCDVKEGGGLGFKILRDLILHFWKNKLLVTEANPLVSKLLAARYFPKSCFLEVKLGQNPSYVWRSLVATQEIMNKGCIHRIGDGKSTRIWHVPWLPSLDNGYSSTDMPEELKEATIDNLFDEDQRRWDEDILRDICNSRDYELINQVQIPLRHKSDFWYW